ncbi:hypothetical protein [Fodinibius sp.]|uniref:hypothetical protein n=1 Tax=Fodinibius sp. TaxID=1872440 RepID=UPI002ACD8478|nr:hypothetical protein [Fodinibius sp.]MDZ7659669.1 hypothetical protein [Fodinibius sp.]
MVKITIADQTKPLEEVDLEWISGTISKNRIMDKENPVEINIETDTINLDLFANHPKAGQEKATNYIESRVLFHWKELVLSKDNLDPKALSEFLKQMKRWVSFVPKE